VLLLYAPERLGCAPQSSMAGIDPQHVASNRHVQADGSVLILGRSIRFRIATLKPGYVLMTCSGGRSNHPDDAQAELAMLHELDLELKRAGALTVFADLRDASRMTAESREVASTWMRENRERLKGSHVLVGSKLLEMAMSIVGMLVGGGILKVYSQPRAFLDIVRGAAPNLVELPSLAATSATGS
jgi:hypothetical protein